MVGSVSGVVYAQASFTLPKHLFFTPRFSLDNENKLLFSYCARDDATAAYFTFMPIFQRPVRWCHPRKKNYIFLIGVLAHWMKNSDFRFLFVHTAAQVKSTEQTYSLFSEQANRILLALPAFVPEEYRLEKIFNIPTVCIEFNTNVMWREFLWTHLFAPWTILASGRIPGQKSKWLSTEVISRFPKNEVFPPNILE